NVKTNQLEDFFNTRQEYGYQLQKTFAIRDLDDAGVKKIMHYAQRYGTEEIYISIADADNEMINKIIHFAENNFIVLKFLPDKKDIFSRKIQMQYYGVLTIIALRSIPMDIAINKNDKPIYVVEFFI